jgi:hypothetical protein
VKLWEPRFDAFRGQLALVASARDRVGNAKEANGAIPVTRWKWSYELYDSSSVAPAIGARGTIYVATSYRLMALTPEGTLKWEVNPGNNVRAPVVGQAKPDGFGGTTEIVYVAAGYSPPALFAYDGDKGGLRTSCPTSGSYSGGNNLNGALTLLTTKASVGDVETVVGFLQGSPNRFVAIRPEAETIAERCPEFGTTSSNLPRPLDPGTLISQGTNLFYASESSTCCGNEVTSYVFGSVQPRLDWPVKINATLGSPVLVSTQLVIPRTGSGSDSGGLISVPTSGGWSTLRYPIPDSGSLGGLSVGSGNEAFLGFYNYSQGYQMHRVPLGGGTATVKQITTLSPSTPVLGRDGTLYMSTGALGAWSAADLSPRWSAPFSSSNELTLDCARDATGTQLPERPGVLYQSADNDRRLYSIVVDSPGLDASAAWPKFQHDVRNTGNPATPVTNCQ